MKCMLRDAGMLAQHNIAVPGQGRYRRLIRETIETLGDADPAPDTSEVLMEAILDSREASRVIMSNPVYLGAVNRVFEDGMFYATAGPRMQVLGKIFGEDRLTVMMGLRNPATFVPALFAQATRMGFLDFMGGIDPRQVRWSEVIARMRAALPGAQLVLWANEDTPMIWEAILRQMSGLGEESTFVGVHDLLESIMSAEGMTRFRAYVESRKPTDDAQMRRVIAAFLDKYAIEGEVLEEVDLPGWDAPLVEELTRNYETDCAAIAARTDVTWIAP